MFAQCIAMQVTQLNHVAIHVRDLEASCRFYANILKLQEIPRPAFSFPGAWFRLGVDQELHLIAREPKEGAITPPRERHYALMVADMDAAKQHLLDKGVEHSGPNPRPDGALQVFLRDPDEHVIELCTPPSEA